MSDYVIITDTSADIPADILDKGQIHLIPMVYQLNGEEMCIRDRPYPQYEPLRNQVHKYPAQQSRSYWLSEWYRQRETGADFHG